MVVFVAVIANTLQCGHEMRKKMVKENARIEYYLNEEEEEEG